MCEQKLTREEEDIIIEDARFGDLETLQEIFAELSPSLLLNIKDEFSNSTTIHMAAANGHYDTVKYLLSILPKDEAKNLVNAQNNEGNTALHWAALNGHLKVVELLCDEYDADAFIKNKFHHDPIYEAENNGKEEVETYFLKKFDVEPSDNGDGEEEIRITEKDVEVTPGKEIDQITQEQIDQIETNEEFLKAKTKDLSLE